MSFSKEAFLEFLFDKKRAAYRGRRGRSWIADFLLYSSAYEYRIVRFLVCLPVGIVVGLCLWMFVLQKLNVVDWSAFIAGSFQWLTVCAIGVTFAWSPVFRCTCLVAMLGALGKQGQTLLTVFVLERVVDGPLSNMVDNFEATSDSMLCHMALASEMAAERVKLQMKPIQDMVVDFAAGSAEAKKAISLMDEIFAPIRFEMERTQEDVQLADDARRFDSMAAMQSDIATRKPAVSPHAQADDGDGANFSQPFDSDIARNYAEKLHLRCDDIYERSFLLCYGSTGDLKGLCYKTVPWFLQPFVCWRFDAFSFCDYATQRAEREALCKRSNIEQQIIPPNFDRMMVDAETADAQIADEMKVNVHYRVVEQPRLLRLHSLGDVRNGVKTHLARLKAVVRLISALLKTVLLLLVCRAFSNAFDFTSNYLKDISFQNTFTTRYFWAVDERRAAKDLPQLQPIRKFEKKAHKLSSPYSLPTASERAGSIVSLAKWLFIAVACVAILLQDSIFHSWLSRVRDYGKAVVRQKGESSLVLQVNGTGFVAKMVRSLLTEVNATQTLNQSLDNSRCLVKLHEPDWPYNLLNVGLPLLVMLLLQVVFSFVVMRGRLFWVAGVIFRQRHKARVLHLYNKMTMQRADYMQMARARIRYRVRRLLLRGESNWKGRHKWWQRAVDAIGLVKPQCVVCGERVRLARAALCEHSGCGVPYCNECWTDLGATCYACAATQGVVTSAMTRVAGMA